LNGNKRGKTTWDLQELVFEIQNSLVVIFPAQGFSEGNRDGAFRKISSNSSLKVNVRKTCGKSRLDITRAGQYEYWSIFVFIFKDFGHNSIHIHVHDQLCLDMNIFTSEEAQNRLYMYQKQIKLDFLA
jgi:hypothetical protein